MISPDAKCVVNGSKLNEAIMAFNPLLAMNVSLGDVVEPSVKYSEGGVQITLPSPFEYANEELDVVNSDNTAGTRWFLTSTSQGGSSSSLESSTTTTSNTPINKSNQSRPKRNRDKLNREGGGQNNRDQLNRAAGGGDSRVGVNSAGFDMGGPSGVASDSRVGVNDAGFDVGGPSGVASDSRVGVNDAGFDMGGDNMPPPLPGGAPLVGDTTPESTPRAARSSSPMASQEIIDAGQWVPQTGGMPNIQELGKIVEGGNASQYQKDFYDNAMGNSLPTKDGKVNLQAIRDNIEQGVATPYQQDFYDKAMGGEPPSGAGAVAAATGPEKRTWRRIKQTSSAANTNITKMEDELRIARARLRSLKRTNDFDAPIIKSQQRLVDELKRQVAAARA